MTDFHNYERKLNQTLNRIEKENFPSQDKKLILGFILHSQAQGVSLGRLNKLSWTLLGLKRRFPVVGMLKLRRETLALVYVCELTDLPFLVTVKES